MPIFIRGSGGGSSAKLEGERYVSPSTSGAVTITPNSGYDGFRDVYVYGYNSYDVTGTDADDEDVLSGKTYWSKYDYIRTGTMKTISAPAPTITYNINSAEKKVYITSSYSIDSAGYNSNASVEPSATINIEIPKEEVIGETFQQGTANLRSNTTTVLGVAYISLDTITSESDGKSLKYLIAYASSNATTEYGSKYIMSFYYSPSERNMEIWCSEYESSGDFTSCYGETITSGYLASSTGIAFDSSQYSLANSYRFIAVYE